MPLPSSPDPNSATERLFVSFPSARQQAAAMTALEPLTLAGGSIVYAAASPRSEPVAPAQSDVHVALHWLRVDAPDETLSRWAIETVRWFDAHDVHRVDLPDVHPPRRAVGTGTHKLRGLQAVVLPANVPEGPWRLQASPAPGVPPEIPAPSPSSVPSPGPPDVLPPTAPDIGPDVRPEIELPTPTEIPEPSRPPL